MAWQQDLDEAFAFMHEGDKLRQQNNWLSYIDDLAHDSITLRAAVHAMRSENVDEYTIGRILARIHTDLAHDTIAGVEVPR